MELKQLTYFVAVAEAGTVGRAAERLNISQPPLTRQIQQLEAELGVQLFLRSARGMEVTTAGKDLLRRSKNILQLAEQAAEGTRRAGTGEVGQLSIGVYGSAMFGLIPRVLAEFRATYPHVELQLMHAQTPAQIPALRDGRVDIVFERLLPDEIDINVELVAREKLFLALSDRHSLAKTDEVDVTSLQGETIIIGSSPSAAAIATNLCRSHGFEPRFAPPANDVTTAALLAAADFGVTFVPESMTHVKYPGIAYRQLLSRFPAYMDLHCFYLKSAVSPLLNNMLSTISNVRRTLARRAP